MIIYFVLPKNSSQEDFLVAPLTATKIVAHRKYGFSETEN